MTAIQKMFNQGSLRQTQNPFDLAIQGNGFFQVQLPDGTLAYSRAGNFTANEAGTLVTPDGYPLQPQVAIPNDASQVTIESDGTISVVQAGQVNTLGQIQVASFINPAGLSARGSNLFVETVASGAAQLGTPGENQYGSILQGFQESSNVNLVEEMVDMILAQRSYEVNSRSVRTADSLLQTASQIVR
jgi:flagellar basal-body rod protein FlgG